MNSETSALTLGAFGENVRPHPGPLPQESGNLSPSLSKTYGWIGRTLSKITKNARWLFPLPGGKGQGEGELRNIHRNFGGDREVLADSVIQFFRITAADGKSCRVDYHYLEVTQ